VSLQQHRDSAPRQLRFAVVTISDTRDAASDRGGPYLVERVEGAGHVVSRREIVRDEGGAIRDAVRAAVSDEQVDLVLTTGGTGISPRDVTYDTLRALFDSEIPGFGELFRMLSHQQIGAAAMLSRAIGGVLGGKVVLAMPGSPKALALAMDSIVLPEAAHLVQQTRVGR